MTRILIADDHPLYRLALVQAVRGVMPDAELYEAHDLDTARQVLIQHPDTDLVLLDLHMPGSHGLMGLAALRAEHPGVAVVMISAHDDPTTIRRALAYGAAGYLTKRADLAELQAGLRAVLACEQYLPPKLRDAVASARWPFRQSLAHRVRSRRVVTMSNHAASSAKFARPTMRMPGASKPAMPTTMRYTPSDKKNTLRAIARP